jgi:hypothetical protein
MAFAVNYNYVTQMQNNVEHNNYSKTYGAGSKLQHLFYLVISLYKN